MTLSYRSKLLLGFLGLAISASALVSFLGGRHAKSSILKQIQSQVLTVALEVASQIPADKHAQIRSEEDSGGEAYQQIASLMRDVRDRNRREDVHVSFIYTFRQTGSQPDQFAYVVDAEEPGENRSPVGEVIVWEEQGTAKEEPMKLGPAYVDQHFATDSYGSWLSGYAPIRDRSGEIVAMVGVDIAADSVKAQQAEVARWLVVGLAIALFIATALSILLSRIASQPLAQIASAVERIGEGHLEVRLPVPEMRDDEFGTLAIAVNEMAQSLQERDALKGALSRLVSQEAARRLIEEDRLPKMHGEKREITVLIADIANLSGLADRLPPEHLIELLNEYFEKMVEIIFRNHGTIDRLLGDRLIAVFGAPLDDPEKEAHAIRATITMRRELARLNSKWNLGGGEAFRLGVGIHTGSALLGNIGSRGAVEYTVVGSSIEIASLIGAQNQTYNTETLVSEATVRAAGNEFGFTEVGDIQPAGLRDFIRLYSVRAATG